jgi:CBS domain-containing protein
MIQDLLEAKGSTVVTIGPSATLVEAARTLVDHRIGALVVVDDGGGMIGIVSERDLMRAIVTYAEGLFERRVEDVMTRSVATCAPEDSLVEALSLMGSRRIRHLPVLVGDTLAGMISIRDVTGEWLGLMDQENRQLRDEVGARQRRSA